MKSYSYVAQDARGKQVKGKANAENEQEFLEKMKERGVFIKDYAEDDSSNSRSISTGSAALYSQNSSAALVATSSP